MSTLKEAAHRAGGTLNDGFLAGVTGGLRRYHEEHGAQVGDLKVTMPISIRAEGDAEGGNRITLMRFPCRSARSTRSSGSRRSTSARARGASRALAAVHPGHRRRAQPAAALVHRRDPAARGLPGQQRRRPPGAGVRRRRAGADAVRVRARPSAPASTSRCSRYVDTCALGINVDTGAVPDVELLGECLVAGFDEVLALGRLPPRRTRRSGRRRHCASRAVRDGRGATHRRVERP